MTTPKPKARLGKGLSSLLSDASKNISKEDIQKTTGVFEVNIKHIEPNPFQPRKQFDDEALSELTSSIKNHGLIQPITLRKIAQNSYQIIAGERRWRAAQAANVEKLPAYIREANNTTMLELAIVENLQREDLNAIEIAIHFQRMLDECSLKQEELAERVNKNRSTITNYLRLLKLPPEVQVSLRDGDLTMGHARAIINVPNIEKQLYCYNLILEKNLSVREVEQLVKNLNKVPTKNTKPPQNNSNAQLQQVQNQLMDKFNTKVELKKGKGKGGKIIIPFYSQDDLKRLIDLLD